MAIRTNLMTNPSFEVDLSGTTPSYGTSGAGTLTRPTTGGYAGSAFARMTWTTASTAVSGYLQMAVPGTLPNGTVSASVWVRVNSPQRLQLNFTGSAVSVVIPAVDVPANTWTKISGTAVVGGSGYTIYVGAAAGGSARNWAVGDTFDADAVLVEVGTTGEFFDGSTVNSGFNYVWNGPVGASTSQESTSTDPFVKSVTTGAITTAANPTVTLAATPAAGDVLILSTVLGQSGDPLVTAVSGLGATWSRVPGGNSYTTFWVGTGATSSGTVTATATAATSGRVLRLHHLANVTADVSLQQYYSSFPVQATPSQIVIGAAYSQTTTTPLGAKTPAVGWTDDAEIALSSTRKYNTTYARAASTASFNVAGATYSIMLVVGSPVAGSSVTKVNGVANSSGETSPSGWVSSNMGSITASTAQKFSGTKSLTATANAANASFTQANNGPVLPIVGGTTTVTLSAYVYSSSARTAGIVPKWLGATSSVLSTGTLAGTVLTPNTWTRVTWTGVGPGGAAPAYFVAPSIVFSDSVSGDVLYVDAVMAEYGSTATEYFDGSTASAGHTNAFTGASDTYPSVQTTTSAAPAKTIDSQLSGAGTLTASLHRNIKSALSGSGTLTSSLAYTKRIDSQLAGSGTLTSALHRYITSALSGSGTLTSTLAGLSIHSDFSGSGTLTSVLKRSINSALSGSGTLTSSLAYTKRIDSALSGEATLTSALATSNRNQISSRFTATGWLTSVLKYRTRIDSRLGAEVTLYSELGYVAKPVEVGDAPLGKLASFSISTAAVPLNPAEGSGSTPSINAAYIKGTDPEYALGESNVLKNGAIGTYEGEVVKVGTSVASARASISMDTALTPLNTELHLFPFIDGVPGLRTAGRAIDYWTQQAGLFYDKVPGECIAYASGFGHTDSYGAGITGRFYEKLTGGTADTQVVNGRSVKTLGSAVTGKTALHEVKDGAVSVSLPKNRKLVFSIGLGLNGSGRMGTVEWSFLDARNTRHTVSLAATSEGTVTAKVGSTVVDSASVPAGGTYRLVLSLERLSSTALAGKLSVLTDDLAGSGAPVYTGNTTVITVALPGALRLTGFEHRSAGGAGAQMTRWGTYLAVSDQHPAELPAVQKVLAETKKPFGFVSGFTGNVWNLLNEFCSIARLELRFTDGALRAGPRTNTISTPGVPWSRFEADRSRREKYKQVAVVNKQSKAVSTDDAVLWRADSVFQVAAREVFETTVQTGHSILNLVQPVPVNGILPFPYKQGGGQYVVTGADGYIVAPQWWIDNGGKVEVSLTGKEGEIAIKITAPTLDSVRAPYRISEGAADRPALYVCGSGIINDPKEVHVSTGAKNAREGFDSVFESPFLAGVRETYDTAAAMAQQYSASVAEVQYELPNSFDTPTGLGQFPAGTLVTDNQRNYLIQDANQTHSKVSGNAVPHTTIAAYVASYPAGATIRDEKARNAGRTIRKFNIKPLKGDA